VRIVCFWILLLILVSAVPTWAEPTVNCHCFKDRNFDPEYPRKVEPYLLATSQNSFMATVFQVEKFKVVKERMSGVSGEDLWVAYYLWKKTGIEPASLLNARGMEKSWNGVISKAGIDEKSLDPGFRKALEKGSGVESLASAVVDEALCRFLGGRSDTLDTLRSTGATNQEVILASFFSRKLKQPAAELLAAVRAGQLTWGGLANDHGVKITEMDKELLKLMQ